MLVSELGGIDVDNLDIGNAAFEGVGSLVTWLNVRALYRDKQVAGVDWKVILFFATWGLWNLYYYPMIGHVLSALAGVVLCAGNLTWVAMALYYRRRG